MARLAGVDLPRNKHMERALTYIYGIGLASARKILDKADLPYQMNSDDLSSDDVKLAESGKADYFSSSRFMAPWRDAAASVQAGADSVSNLQGAPIAPHRTGHSTIRRSWRLPDGSARPGAGQRAPYARPRQIGRAHV